MPTTRSTAQVGVADIVARPGRSRPLHRAFDAPGGLELPLARIDEPLAFDGVLESVVDGVLVRGTLEIPLALACARCLRPLTDTVHAEVVELFADPASAADPDEVEQGYEILDDAIDLDTLLRDAVVPAVPVAPRCRDDCRGLCPRCGADRNTSPCDCTDTDSDPRWSALRALRLDPGTANGPG